jgi:VWFA-related protein
VATVVGSLHRPGIAAGVTADERYLVLTVLDDAGAPITGLTAEQFVILEDGAVRPVTSVRPATEPLSVAIMVDMTQPPFGETLNVRDIRSGVSAFVKTVLAAQPDAEVQLMEYAGASTVRVKFTSDVEALDKSANRLFQNQQGGGPLMEAIVDAARDLRGRKSLRRAIVTIDRSSPDPSRVQTQDLTAAVELASASVWSISVQAAGRGSSSTFEVLDYLTKGTGGTYQTVQSLTPLEGMLTRIAQALTSQYVVAYTRPSGATVSDVLAGTTGAGNVLMSRLAER